jgi:hypothetical protein
MDAGNFDNNLMAFLGEHLRWLDMDDRGMSKDEERQTTKRRKT